MQESNKYIVAIVGPTAIGKTSTAIKLAKHFNAEIISADSRQFYKEMKIGTALPAAAELSEVKHHFIQHRSIEEEYTVGDFEAEAIAIIEELFLKHDILFLVGGSGLYIDAVTKGLDIFPKVPPAIREELKKEFANKGIEPLQKKLEQCDPEYFKKADIQNPHRVIRALEICLGTGKPFSSFLGKRQTEREFEVIKIGLTADRKEIYDRINRRVDIMIENGLPEEAGILYPKKELNALQTVGYRELFSYLEKEVSLEEAIEQIKKNTRRYAKRQMTWFKKDETIKWFNYQEPSEEIIRYIKEKRR